MAVLVYQVVPFLVLAIGVDNIFILTAAMRKQRWEGAPGLEEAIGCALAQAGPSITAAAACEVLAFALGATAPMPAVRNFSICAALAVFLDFVLQVALTL